MLTEHKPFTGEKEMIEIAYVVGCIDRPQVSNEWSLAGIFEDKKEAEDACIDETFFVGPTVMNKILTPYGINIPWPGGYYPRRSPRHYNPCPEVYHE